MKKIGESILDKKREITQMLLLFFTLLLPSFINLSEKISVIFGTEELSFETAKYYYLMKAGNPIIGLVFMFIVLFKYIRPSNKKAVLNKGNLYHDHSYIWFWLCSKILGYENCNLILVPIHMQIKLVVRDTVTNFLIDDDMFPEGNNKVFKSIDNKEYEPNNINLILEDTYFIRTGQIKEFDLDKYTIRISREIENEGTRSYSSAFVDEVVASLRELPENTEDNIFSTINPKHSFEISKKGIALANRENLKHLFVYQQENEFGNRKFEKKYKMY
ncbi:MAG: hypothetical protein ACTJGH_01945 [Peptoniphilaceae bacterium]